MQSSVDRLGAARRAIMAQQHALAAPLLGDNDRIIAASRAGVFATAGSVAGGATGRVNIGQGVALLGGLSYGAAGYRSSRIEDVFLLAAKLRYVHNLSATGHLLAEIGGFWSPSGSYAFTRSYVNGAGTAKGIGRSNADQHYIFARVGGVFEPGRNDELALSAELGRQSLSTDGYREPQSVTNPFEAQVSAARDTATVAKAKLQWSHDFSDRVDATIWGAVAHQFSQASTLRVDLPGFGALVPIPQDATFGEFGGRIGYRLTDRVVINAFANGATGSFAGETRVHVGGSLNVVF